WAGLSHAGFLNLIASDTTTQSQFETFLSSSPQNYNNPDINLADAGYCKYFAPDPYGSEYSGRDHPTCFAPCPSILGCNPPTPTYDQFVKWGQALSAYGALNSAQFAQQAKSIGTAVGIGMATGAAIAAGAIAPAVLVAAPNLAAAVTAAIAS